MVVYHYRGKPIVAEYAGPENEAKVARRGLWSSEFQKPWQYRDCRNE
jgi:endonuclease YncB( thermonuclease family)